MFLKAEQRSFSLEYKKYWYFKFNEKKSNWSISDYILKVSSAKINQGIDYDAKW